MAQEVGAKAQVGSITGKDGGKGLCVTKWKADKMEDIFNKSRWGGGKSTQWQAVGT